MLNRVVLIGRLVKSPELRYTQSDIPVATFTLAVDRAFKNAQGERETDFIKIVVWRQQGENCAQYLSKGKLAAVDGSLQLRNYTDKDGVKRTAAEVVADNVRFLSPKDGQARQAPPPQDVLPFGGAGDNPGDDMYAAELDELPF